MEQTQLLDASTRVALAAYLHDLGKFSERADIAAGKTKDADGISLKDTHVQQYCPSYNNRHSHIHAAYTAIALDLIEPYLPDIKVKDCTPFASWKDGAAMRDGDSLINAAARHHKPETFLQWIIAAADRLASGFERNEFEDYNRAEEIGKKRNYKQTRQFVLFENIRLNKRAESDKYRYPLKALSPASIFPELAEKIESNDDKTATAQYDELWNQFIDALKKSDGSSSIPKSHRAALALWFDHFDTLWQTFTHCIPSATAGKVDGKFIAIPADVSLYDHSRTTAALATALWRFHDEQERAGSDCVNDIKKDAFAENSEEKFLLIQGDMFGIQDFIFANGGSTQKFAAKLLRGRSFYVSLLTECASLKLLDALSLPPTSQVTNAAGKFLIVAPNTVKAREAVEMARIEIDDWFLRHSQGRAGLGLAVMPASSSDFRRGKNQQSPFRDLMARLFQQLEHTKLQRLNLCGDTPAVFSDFLDSFNNELGVCALDGISPATQKDDDDISVGAISLDQKRIGGWLASQKLNRILITRSALEKQGRGLKTPVFGLHVTFTQDEDVSGKFGGLAESGELLRTWDISLPDKNGEKALWNGYARRNINSYVPVFDTTDNTSSAKYKQWEDELDSKDFDGFTLKTLNHIACENRTMPDASDFECWQGVAALHAFKGDVDNLGSIFQKGLEQPSFARMAGLSRQMNNFFAVYLPYLCRSEFSNTYTVFAGGDDFYLIGPWRSQTQLAKKMQQEFARYVGENPDIHFSAGLFLSKPGVPIRHLGERAESALDEAKKYADKKGNQKNAITCYGQTMGWKQFTQLLRESKEIDELRERYALSTGLVYGLLKLSDMAGNEKSDKPKPEDSLWRSWLSYRVARLVGDKMHRSDDESPQDFATRRRDGVGDVCVKLVTSIENHRSRYHVALFEHLYQFRD